MRIDYAADALLRLRPVEALHILESLAITQDAGGLDEIGVGAVELIEQPDGLVILFAED